MLPQWLVSVLLIVVVLIAAYGSFWLIDRSAPAPDTKNRFAKLLVGGLAVLAIAIIVWRLVRPYV